MTFAPKTAAAGIGGTVAIALVTVLEWILGFWHISMPAAVSAAIATIISTVLSYYAPPAHPPPPTDSQSNTP